MIDIYARNFEDPSFVEDQLEMFDDLDLFLQQIETVLLTDKTEVLGAIQFGASLESYIHSLNFPATEIKSSVYNQINTYCTLAGKFNYSVDVNFYRGDVRDIGVIDIIINGNKLLGFVVS